MTKPKTRTGKPLKRKPPQGKPPARPGGGRKRPAPDSDPAPIKISPTDGSDGSDPASMDISPATDSDPVTKRQKLVGDSGVSIPSGGASPSTSSVRPQLHDDLPAGAKVKLKPLLQLKPDGTIDALQISALQRTPSPFGSRMGDHTVAWASVVDALHATVVDLSPDQALAALRAAHERATAWMNTPDLAGMRLLDALEDRDRRIPRLEDSAWHTADFLDQAEEALKNGNTDEAVAALEDAIAQHLSFVNYLPFATVPAESERGSKGSGEAAKRRRILAAEDGSLENATMLEDFNEVKALRDDLWGMFAFDAALRAAEVRLVLDPKAVETVQTQLDTLRQLTTDIEKEMTDQYWQPGDPRVAEAIERKAVRIAKDPAAPAGIVDAALTIQKAAQSLRGNNLETPYTRQKAIKTHRALVAEAIKAAQQAAEDFTHRVDQALPRAALILAHLLHEHQQTMATAYPRAVTVSGFLDPTPTDAAMDHLVAMVGGDAGRMDMDPGLDRLLDEVIAKYESIQPPPQPANRNGWIRNAAKIDLVVRYDSTKPERLTVNGRAPAPTGVAGMGSHTTSWRTEVRAVNALVAAPRTDAEALKALHDEVLSDLDSDVMKLDRFLPADQLEGGQLLGIFAAARATLDATDVGTAAAAYLTFRNLLPFATVDVGNRAGRGEAMSDTAAANLDNKSLQQAAQLQQEALTKRRAEAATALENAAQELRDAWGSDKKLSSLVRAAAKRLEQQAGSRAASKNVSQTIIKARTREHGRVSKLAGFTS